MGRHRPVRSRMDVFFRDRVFSWLCIFLRPVAPAAWTNHTSTPPTPSQHHHDHRRRYNQYIFLRRTLALTLQAPPSIHRTSLPVTQSKKPFVGPTRRACVERPSWPFPLRMPSFLPLMLCFSCDPFSPEDCRLAVARPSDPRAAVTGNNSRLQHFGTFTAVVTNSRAQYV